MTKLFIGRFAAIIFIACLSFFSQAQSAGSSIAENKPYKILTSGRQITVKSTKAIQSIMVWTASGHRIIEERDVNNTTFSFNVNTSSKVFFVMIHYPGSKPYTEKIGIQ